MFTISSTVDVCYPITYDLNPVRPLPGAPSRSQPLMMGGVEEHAAICSGPHLAAALWARATAKRDRSYSIGVSLPSSRPRSPQLCAKPCADRPRSSSLPVISFFRRNRGPRWACLISDRRRPRLFRATPRRDPDGLAPRSEARPIQTGRRFMSQPLRISKRYEPTATSRWILQSDGYGRHTVSHNDYGYRATRVSLTAG